MQNIYWLNFYDIIYSKLVFFKKYYFLPFTFMKYKVLGLVWIFIVRWCSPLKVLTNFTDN